MLLIIMILYNRISLYIFKKLLIMEIKFETVQELQMFSSSRLPCTRGKRCKKQHRTVYVFE